MSNIIGNQDKEKTSKVDTQKWKEHSEYYKNLKNNRKKERKEQSANDLERKVLKYDSNGVPTLNIYPKANTYIDIDEPIYFDNMMQIFESAGWTAGTSKKKPTETNYENMWGKVSVGFSEEDITNKKFRFAQPYVFKNSWYVELAYNEFCNIQKITLAIMTELNAWYNRNQPNRESAKWNLPF